MISLLGLVIALIGGLAVRAAMWPSMSYSASVQVNAPQQQVWDMLSVPEQRVRWQRGVVDIVPLIDGELMLGARNLVLFHAGNERHELEEEVTEYEPLRTLHLAHATEDFSAIISYELEAAAPSAPAGVVRQQIQRTPSSFMERLVAPFFYFREASYAQGALDRLKELAEDAARNE